MPNAPKLSPVKVDPDHHQNPVQPSDTYSPDEMPAKVDLRPHHMPPVFNQLQVESCTANALAGAYGYLEGRVAQKQITISRLFLYYNERALEGDPDKDSGAKLRDGVKVLEQYGACTETTWPYDDKKVKVKPHDEAYAEGKGHEIDQAAAVAIDLHAMRHCLVEGYPFVFIVLIDSAAFNKVGKDGMIPTPKVKTGLSGHALMAVGYDDAKKVFIVRNSWGATWGDKGYCYLPYDYLTDKTLCFDPWTLRRGHGLDFSMVNNPAVPANTEGEEEETDDSEETDGEDETDESEDESEDEGGEEDETEGEDEEGEGEDGEEEGEEGDEEEGEEDESDEEEDEGGEEKDEDK